MIALRQAWRAAEPRGWSVSQRVSWGQGAEGLAQALSGAWLIFIMSSIQALPRTLMDVFNFSLRAGGRPRWTQRPKCRSAHSHRPDFCGMSSAWPARCLSCQAPNCGKPCVSQDWLVTLLASSSEGALSTSWKRKSNRGLRLLCSPPPGASVQWDQCCPLLAWLVFAGPPFPRRGAMCSGDRFHEGGRAIIKSDQHKIRVLMICGKCWREEKRAYKENFSDLMCIWITWRSC